MWLFWCALGATTSHIKDSHTPVRELVQSILPLQHKIHEMQVTTEHCRKLATRLWFSPLCSTIQLSPLLGWPRQSMDETTMWYPLAANFTSRAGPCTGIVEPFKHFLCVTTHPQFLVLELSAPIGTRPGQYGTRESSKVYFLVKWQFILDRLMLLLNDHKHASSFRMPENMANSNSIFWVMLYLHPHHLWS